MSVHIKVLVDDCEVPLPDGVVKVIVEGLVDDDNDAHEIHTAFTHEGIVRDIIMEGEIIDTQCGTYEELFDILYGDDEDEDEDEDEEVTYTHKHTMFFQVDISVRAAGATPREIDNAVDVQALILGSSDPVTAQRVDRVVRIDVVPTRTGRNGG